MLLILLILLSLCRLEDQAERTKKILSANSETTFAIECLMEDRDLSGLITRELFEELCANTFKPSLLKLLQQALNISGELLRPAAATRPRSCTFFRFRGIFARFLRFFPNIFAK